MSPYDAGYRAYHTGERNLYTTGTREYDEWNKGWADADYDERECQDDTDDDCGYYDDDDENNS